MIEILLILIIIFLYMINKNIGYIFELIQNTSKKKTDYYDAYFGENILQFDSTKKDPLFNQAIEIIKDYENASASLLQRKLSIGYARAVRLLDQLEDNGNVGPAVGSKARNVLK